MASTLRRSNTRSTASSRKNAEARYAHHEIERWRDRLIADDAALTDYICVYPTTDRAQLRALIRAARKQTDDPTAFRALFRHLRENAAFHETIDHAADPDDASVPPTVT